uniref:Uncharacterized protein n=1 Tax=Solanum lycopersicum TaxID=4081 RepID=A0A3Q7JNK7_SOLLC
MFPSLLYKQTHLSFFFSSMLTLTLLNAYSLTLYRPLPSKLYYTLLKDSTFAHSSK